MAYIALALGMDAHSSRLAERQYLTEVLSLLWPTASTDKFILRLGLASGLAGFGLNLLG